MFPDSDRRGRIRAVWRMQIDIQKTLRYLRLLLQRTRSAVGEVRAEVETGVREALRKDSPRTTTPRAERRVEPGEEDV